MAQGGEGLYDLGVNVDPKPYDILPYYPVHKDRSLVRPRPECGGEGKEDIQRRDTVSRTEIRRL